MLSAALAGLAVAQAVLAGLALRRRDPLLAAVGAGIAYDSAVIGLGASLGEGEALRALSVGRFVGHAALTPLLVVWAARLGSPRRVRRAAWGVAAALVLYGLVTEVAGLRLEPRHYADTLRLAPAGSGPPIPALVALAVVGAAAWRTRRRALLAATAVTFAASGAAVAVPPLGNLGEALLLAAMALTRRPTADRHDRPPEGPPDRRGGRRRSGARPAPGGRGRRSR
ncbi:hypothetical protein [Actinomadura kijaniata]|uniref:hypothetical protein n=1 Tax=Actinomadura kijaniata TaxID=46161 RepID=UPI000830C2B0|nr:hypothetical protein [Actinomadura kijaniata]